MSFRFAYNTYFTENFDPENYTLDERGINVQCDMIELKAVKRLFETNLNSLSISSTKSMTGHLLGAAGAVEAIFSILAIHNQEVPPTINLKTPDEDASEFDLVPNRSKKKNIKNILSNSFGFGGTNASLIFGRID